MGIDLKSFGEDLFGGSIAGNILFGNGGSLNDSILGIAPGQGGQPPLRDAPSLDAVSKKGGFLQGVSDFFNKITGKISDDAGSAAGSAFYEKAKPWLIGGAIVGGALLISRWRK